MTDRLKVILAFGAFVIVVLVIILRPFPNRGVQELPAAEIAKVIGNARLYGFSLFGGELYNGSSFALREMIVTITAREASGETRWSRQFKSEIYVKPLTTSPFYIPITGAERASLNWNIVSVKGEPKGY